MNVRQLLERKHPQVWSIAPDGSVFDAIELMASKSIGALLVLDAGKVVGIVSERDYARKVILKGRASKETPVRDIMTTDVLFVSPDRTLEESMALMTEKRIRHLPVLDGDELIGIFSVGDIIKAIISEQKFTIEQLERYIKGV